MKLTTRTKRLFRIGLFPLALIAAIGLGGCGGGGSAAPASGGIATASGRGTLTMQVRFPPVTTYAKGKGAGRGRSASRPVSSRPSGTRSTGPGSTSYNGHIPTGTQALRVTVTDPATGANLALPQTVTEPAPASQFGTVHTISFTSLPPGPVRVTAFTYPNAAADNATDPIDRNLTAAGSVNSTIVANQTVSAQLLLTLALSRVTLTPSFVTLTQNSGSATLTAMAFGDSNQPLRYTYTFSSSDPTLVSVSQTGPDTVEIAPGNGVGTATITAMEVDSGLMATSTITVAQSNGSGP